MRSTMDRITRALSALGPRLRSQNIPMTKARTKPASARKKTLVTLAVELTDLRNQAHLAMADLNIVADVEPRRLHISRYGNTTVTWLPNTSTEAILSQQSFRGPGGL
eukprot:CAMPEP_0180550312 /NCGR_PEP_ID=MMETSP1036_2-20121128/72573_1 /TAXON_ID=632150 /ORGANISM="Azadinium spinosum, Strain 3D9" /LENGTH=106 /DNA_ID=CAMNT_0022565547 /DNA_START=1190 /DNA_END=1510 /DNA_ORIENTATION=+